MSKKNKPIPLFNQPISETHCHLDYLNGDELDSALQRASDVGVHKFLTIATEPGNLQIVIDIASRHPNIWCTQGVHPHDAKSVTPETLQQIRDQSTAANRVLAIGEIGLDYHYEYSQRDIQIPIFEQQLQIAVDLDLPVVIHTREADDDTRAVLANFSNSLKGNGVIHSFTSSLELAEFCLNEGFHLGFNGIVTFNRADNVREVLAATPINRILIETDTPYLTPVPYRGKPNEPQYLPFIAERIALEKGIAVDELLKQVEDNACRLFGF